MSNLSQALTDAFTSNPAPSPLQQQLDFAFSQGSNAPRPPDVLSGEVTKGVLRSLAGVPATLQAAYGSAQRLWNPTAAQQNIDDAAAQVSNAYRVEPPAYPTLSSALNGGSLTGYIEGKLGEMLPMALPTVGAAVVGGGLAGLSGAAEAATAILEDEGASTAAKAAAQATLDKIGLVGRAAGAAASMYPPEVGSQALSSNNPTANAMMTPAQHTLHDMVFAAPTTALQSVVPEVAAARLMPGGRLPLDISAPTLAPGVNPIGLGAGVARGVGATGGVLGGAAKEALQNIGVMGATSAASNLVDQASQRAYDPNYKFSGEQAFNAGVDAMAGAGGLLGVHALAAKTLDAAASGAGAVRGAAVGGLNKIASIGEEAAGAVRKSGIGRAAADSVSVLRNTVATTAKMPEMARFLAAQQLPAHLADASTEDIANWLATSPDSPRQTALALAQKQLQDPTAQPIQHEAAQQLLDNADDPEAWRQYASNLQIQQQQERFGTNLGIAASDLKAKAEGAVAAMKGAVLKTAAAVADPIGATKGTVKAMPAAAWDKLKGFVTGKQDVTPTQDDLTFAKHLMAAPEAHPLAVAYQRDPAQAIGMTQVLRQWAAMNFGHTGDASAGDTTFVPRGLTDTFGDATPAVIGRTADLMRRQGHDISPDAVQSAQRLATAQLESSKSTQQIVADNLTLNSQDHLHTSDYPTVAQLVREHVLSGQPNDATDQVLDSLFGANKQKVVDAFTEKYDQDRSQLPQSPQSPSLEPSVSDQAPSGISPSQLDEGGFQDPTEGGHEQVAAPEAAQYVGKSVNEPTTPFDTMDPYFGVNRDAQAQRLAREQPGLQTEDVEGVPQAKHDMVGIVDHAAEQAGNPEGADRAAMLDDLFAKHQQALDEGEAAEGPMSRMQKADYLNNRFKLMRPRSASVGELADPIDIPPRELTQPVTRGGKANPKSWQDITRVGTTDASTVEHGRIYLRTKDGKDFVTSAQKLISKMWDAKRRDAFQGETSEGEGAKDKVAMFSAGLSSLLNAKGLDGEHYFDGSVRVKGTDGKMRDASDLVAGADGKMHPAIDDLRLFNNGRSKLRLGDVRDRESFPEKPGRPSQKLGHDDIKNMTARELDRESRKLGEVLAQHEYAGLRDGPKSPKADARMGELRRAFGKNAWKLDEAKQLPDAMVEGIKAKRAMFDDALAEREGNVDRAPGDRRESAEPGKSETDEMAAANAKAEAGSARGKFDETTGIELHPKEPLHPDSKIAALQRDYASAREQYAALAGKIKELAGKTSVAGAETRAKNLAAMKKDLASIVERGKRLAAKLNEAQKDATPGRGKPAPEAKASDTPLGQTPMTEEQKAAVREDIAKSLGPQMPVIFSKDIVGSGEWTPGLIKVALTALNPLSVGHHEAMHELFSRILAQGHRAADTLIHFANSDRVMRALSREFAGNEAAMRAIKADPEERLAYAYQLWRAGKLDLGVSTKPLFTRIASGIRKLLGLISNDQKAEQIFEAFRDGDMVTPGDMAKSLDTVEMRGATVRRVAKASATVLEKPLELWLGTSHYLTGSDNPFLRNIGELLYNTEGVAGKSGLLARQGQEGRIWANKFGHILEKLPELDEGDLRAAMESGLKGETHADPVIASLQQHIRKLNDDIFKYMEDAGVSTRDPVTGKWVKIRKMPNYWTHSFDVDYMLNHSGEFKAALLEHHLPELQGIADAANREVEDGRGAGVYSASAQKLSNPDGSPVTPADVAQAIFDRITRSGGMSDDALQENPNAVGYTPNMNAVNTRTLDWLNMKVFHEYMQKDMIKTISTYVSQATKRAEYTKLFGPGGEKLQNLMDQAFGHEIDKIMAERYGVDSAMKKSTEAAGATQGAWQEQLNRFAGGEEWGAKVIADAVKKLDAPKRAIMGIEGTLGHDISPLMRKVNGYTITYQNVRLLGYSLFSNLIDMNGLIVRGGTVANAYDALKRGLTEVVHEWGDMTGLKKRDPANKDLAMYMSEVIGVNSVAGGLSAMGDAYNSNFLGDRAKRWNDKFFNGNGMEAFTRGVRAAATQAAIQFIKRHAMNPNAHSERYLHELDLTADDVKSAMNDETGLDLDNQKIQQAVYRWVDGAVVRPNASMRPIWGNDPHFATFFHLKTFMYATQATILKRMAVEAKNGNYDPLFTAMAGYIPIMLVSDAGKSILQSLLGGNPAVPYHTLGQAVTYGAMRAGLLGTYQMPYDMAHFGMSSALGPTGEQLVQAATDPASTTLRKAFAIGPFGGMLNGMSWND